MQKSAPARILRHLRDFGLRGIHLRFLAGFSIYREMPVYHLDFCSHPPQVLPSIPVEFSLLTEEDLDEYLTCAGDSPSDPHTVWGWGATCFLARYKGRIVASIWVAERTFPLNYLYKELPLKHSEIYFVEAFTLPTFRGNRLLPALISHACDHYRSLGRCHAYTIVFSYNSSSIRSFAHVGFKPHKILGFWQFGPWRKHFESPAH